MEYPYAKLIENHGMLEIEKTEYLLLLLYYLKRIVELKFAPDNSENASFHL